MKKAEQENTIQGKNYTSNGDFFKKKKKKRPDYLGKCTEWDHFKLRYIFIEVKLVSS